MPRPTVPDDLRQSKQEAFRVSKKEFKIIEQVITWLAENKLTAYSRSDYYKELVMTAVNRDYKVMKGDHPDTVYSDEAELDVPVIEHKNLVKPMTLVSTYTDTQMPPTVPTKNRKRVSAKANKKAPQKTRKISKAKPNTGKQATRKAA